MEADMIKPRAWRKNRRRWATALCCATGALVGACGGGADEPAGIGTTSTAQDAGHGRTVVLTTAGLVRGLQHEGQRVFLGIPYAAPPVGVQRWQPPQDPESWKGIRDAFTAGSPCAQPIADSMGNPLVLGSEDCLYLNVHAPSKATRLPVVVFIHGGDFRNGAGSDYDASSFSAKGNVVAVTLNYRLGALGFLAHRDLTAQSSDLASGQYGLLDQRFALEWISRNIAAFGGDPDNVTLSGQSSGAYGVCNQLASPRSVDLFHKAILQSGACTSRSSGLPLSVAEQAGSIYSRSVGCSTGDIAACLRGVSVSALLMAPATEPTGSGTGWAPAIGGASYPVSAPAAIRDGTFHKVPILMGSNHNEDTVFVALQEFAQAGPIRSEQYVGLVNTIFGSASAAVLNAYPVAAGPADVVQANLFTDLAFACPALSTALFVSSAVATYLYEFDDPTAPAQVPARFIDQKAYHGAELPYLFTQPMSVFGFGPIADLDAGQKALADKMIGYWAAFAANGNPNTASLPVWSRFGSATIAVQHLGQDYVGPTSEFSQTHRCDFWAGFGV